MTIQPSLVASYARLPLSFEANHGQVRGPVEFLSRGRGYTIFLTADEAVLTLRKSQPGMSRFGKFGLHGRLDSFGAVGPRAGRWPSLAEDLKSLWTSLIPDLSQMLPDPNSGKGGGAAGLESQPLQVMRMRLVGGNAKGRVVGLDELPGRSNYFIGNDPKKWRTNVPSYARVKYEGVYPGVDLVYYGDSLEGGRLEYDFVVAPGADPSQIKLSFAGAEGVRVDAASGDLVMKVGGEEVRFQKPAVYQPAVAAVDDRRTGGGKSRPALGKPNPERRISNPEGPSGTFVLASKNEVSFRVAGYDAKRALVIDPVLVYSTYLGGSFADSASGIAVDSSGNAYVTGYTQSWDFPKVNPLQVPCGDCGSVYAFVAKLKADGSGLAYSTYLGSESSAAGGSDAFGSAIAVDSSGDAYVTGYTNSTRFPTVNPLQSSNAGGTDAFVAKLNTDGSALVYSTYLGGTNNDSGNGIAVDSSGNAYVTGTTQSAHFPTYSTSLQPTYGGGTCGTAPNTYPCADAFVAWLSADCSLVDSTYLGGSNNDSGNGIAVDSSGNVYVIGTTASTDFPTASPLQATNHGGSDAFVAKLNSNASTTSVLTLVYSTYLGGSGADLGYGIGVDSSGNAYVTGSTSSTDFPTLKPFQLNLGGGTTPNASATNAFVTVLNNAGNGFVYSTYLGGSGADVGYGIGVDSFDNAYVTGNTSSTDFPTAKPLQATNHDGSDAFVANLNAAGSALVYSTYLGGSGADVGYGIAVDFSGNAYVSGLTASTDFPIVNALQPKNAGSPDAFVAKISPNLPGATTSLAVADASGAYGGTVKLSATLTSGGSGVSGEPIIFSLNGTGVGTASTNASGVATLAVVLPSGTSAGTYAGYIRANFVGNANYAGSSATSALTVTLSTSIVMASVMNAPYDGTTSLSAQLVVTSPFATLANETLSFSFNGNVLGTAVTNLNGWATVSGSFFPGLNVGSYPTSLISVQFKGDGNYTASAASASLVVSAPLTTTTVAQNYTLQYSGLYSQTVNVVVNVTSPVETVNEGWVGLEIAHTSGTVASGVAWVTNGTASVLLTMPAGAEGVYNIYAGYNDGNYTYPNPYDPNMSMSYDSTHTLTVVGSVSELALLSLTIPPASQLSDPNYVTYVATLVNYGPDALSQGQVQFWYTDATGKQTQLGYSVVSNVPVSSPGSPTIVNVPISTSLISDGSTVWATVIAVTSFDPTISNNTVRGPLINSHAFTQSQTTGAAFSQGGEFEVGYHGYYFHNHVSTTDLWALYNSMFPDAYWTVCIPFTSDCTQVPKPWASAYYHLVFQPGFTAVCYGMAASSLQFFRGQQLLQNFVPGYTSVYSFQPYKSHGDSNYYSSADPFWLNIETFQGIQYGDPVQSWETNSSRDPVTTLTTLEAAMMSGYSQTPQIVSMWGSGFGHAVVPYRIIEWTMPGGTHAADIYIYDSNYPGDPTQTVTVDIRNDTFSSSYVGLPKSNPPCSNDYPCFGGSTGLGLVPSNLNDQSPALPLSGGAGLAVAGVTGPAHLLFTNPQGQSIGYKNGTLVQQVPGARLILPLAQSSSSFPEAYRLPGGQFSTTVSGSGEGSATATLFSSAALLTFTSPNMMETTMDIINLSQDGSTVTLSTNAGMEQYSVTLSTDVGNAAREATVSNTTMASGDSITLILLNGAFQISNQGGAKSFDLMLDQVGTGASQTVFTGLSIGANEIDTFTPGDWTNLGTAPVKLQIQNSQGTVSRTLTASASFDAAFQVSYAANPSAGESLINMINTGANGDPLLGPGFGGAAGNTCVNVYAFDPAEELIACCSCLLTPNQVVNLGVNANLTIKTQTGVAPASVTIKLLNTLAGSTGTSTDCTNSAASAGGAGFPIVSGLVAYGTTPQSVNGGATYNVVEHPFIPATLSGGELSSITGRCASIIGNASGYGICTQCRPGALGAGKQ